MRFKTSLALLPVFVCLSALGYTTDSANKTITTTGASSDVQSAINAASDGWTIVIPSGSYSWSSGVSISGKGIHLKGIGGVSISGSASPKISVNKDSSDPVEVSGISFSGGSMKIRVMGSWNARPFIIHDCSFSESYSTSLLIEVNGALIYNCTFVGSGQYNDQAVKVKMDSDVEKQWTSADTLGMRDSSGERNVYVEDCTFSKMPLQSFDFDGCSRMVVRKCTFTDSAVTSHGACTSPIGMRQYEVYGNRFIFNNYGDCDGSKTPNLDYFFYVRGGTGCIYSNTMDNLSSCAWGNKSEIKLTVYNITRSGGQVPCQTQYPAYQQIGQGHNGSSYFTDPLYIWANSSTADVGRSQYSPDECGNGQSINTYLQSGRDYILSARPGYTAFTYPHPLRSGSQPVQVAPSVSSSPQSQTINAGQSAVFSVSASGSSPLTYQWQKNQANISGATSATYTIAGASTLDGGSYRCVVSNPYGSATSAAATLTVNTPLPVPASIVTSPQSMTRYVGQSATFSVVSAGDAPLSYQWQKNQVNISGATSSSYTIASVSLSDAGSFRCIVTNPLGSATSVAAVLTVQTAPVGNLRYVDATAGNDNNSGSASNPWRRCPGMVGWSGSATLSPGDIVYFDRADTWDMGANSSGAGLDLKAGVHYIGDEWSPQSASSGRATLRATGRHEAGVVRIWEDHASYPTWFEGFVVNANGQRANLIDINHAFWKTGLTKAVKRIEDCLAYGNSGDGSQGDYKYGIIVSDNSPNASGWVANVEILNTVVHTVPRDGICLYPGDNGMVSNVVVRGCEIYNTGNDPSYSEGHGLMMKGNVKDSVFEFCYAHDVNSSAVFINGPENGSGTGPTGCAVRYSVLQTADNNGVIRYYGTGTKRVDVYGNVVLPNEATGGLSFSGNSGSLTARIYNNTFYNSYVDIGSPSSSGTIEFKNNIVYELDDTPFTDTAQKVTSHANNLFYRSGGGTLVRFGGSSYSANNLTSFESTALSADPLFMNPASLPTGFVGQYGSTNNPISPNTAGLCLQVWAPPSPGSTVKSPAIGAGAALGSEFSGSIGSVPRPGTGGWDIGAYQSLPVVTFSGN